MACNEIRKPNHASNTSCNININLEKELSEDRIS